MAPAASVVTAPAHQLRNLAAHQARLVAHSSVPGAQHPKARLLSNKTYYCPTDPDARLLVKHGKALALIYLCSLAVALPRPLLTANTRVPMKQAPRRANSGTREAATPK